MANWVELLNLYVNYETKNKVGDLADQQTAFSEAYRSELQKRTSDNSYYTQLVDIFIQIRKLITDEKYFDAIVYGCNGVSWCDMFYKRITDAETKLKVSDLQIRIIETLVKIVRVDNISNIVAENKANILNEFYEELVDVNIKMKGTHYQAQLINVNDDSIVSGQFITVVRDLNYSKNGKSDFCKKEIFEIHGFSSDENSLIVHLLSIHNTLAYHRKGNGFMFPFGLIIPDPPSKIREIDAIKKMRKIFDEEFLNSHLYVIKQEMLKIKVAAINKATVSQIQIDNAIDEYFELLTKKIISDIENISTINNEEIEHQIENKDKINNSSWVFKMSTHIFYVVFIIIILLVLYLAA
ncbi:MAG: hypothetical protein KF721_15095 [Ignavibacteriaceae bacterium]|nr:hypothetical protein [Ignavibacteriaceae bacterium]